MTYSLLFQSHAASSASSTSNQAVQDDRSENASSAVGSLGNTPLHAPTPITPVTLLNWDFFELIPEATEKCALTQGEDSMASKSLQLGFDGFEQPILGLPEWAGLYPSHLHGESSTHDQRQQAIQYPIVDLNTFTLDNTHSYIAPSYSHFQ